MARPSASAEEALLDQVEEGTPDHRRLLSTRQQQYLDLLRDPAFHYQHLTREVRRPVLDNTQSGWLEPVHNIWPPDAFSEPCASNPKPTTRLTMAFGRASRFPFSSAFDDRPGPGNYPVLTRTSWGLRAVRTGYAHRPHARCTYQRHRARGRHVRTRTSLTRLSMYRRTVAPQVTTRGLALAVTLTLALTLASPDPAPAPGPDHDLDPTQATTKGHVWCRAGCSRAASSWWATRATRISCRAAPSGGRRRTTLPQARASTTCRCPC